MNIFDFNVIDIDGNEKSLNDYKGKVMLIVNVASKCGLTKQYKGLETLYKNHQESGLEILGFPCNQFLGQEPLEEKGIKEFCSINFDVTFDMFSKVDVNGENQAPLFKYLKESVPKGKLKTNPLTIAIKGIDKTLLQPENITWNFNKFLVDQEGNVLKRYEPYVKPSEIEKDIVELLNK